MIVRVRENGKSCLVKQNNFYLEQYQENERDGGRRTLTRLVCVHFCLIRVEVDFWSFHLSQSPCVPWNGSLRDTSLKNQWVKTPDILHVSSDGCFWAWTTFLRSIVAISLPRFTFSSYKSGSVWSLSRKASLRILRRKAEGFNQCELNLKAASTGFKPFKTSVSPANVDADAR
jgi:hypothetical protein